MLFALIACEEAGAPVSTEGAPVSTEGDPVSKEMLFNTTWLFDDGWEIYFQPELEGKEIIDADFFWPNKPNKFAFLHVILSDRTLDGDYEYSYLDGDVGITIEDLAITITMTYTDETLSLRFAGDGVLDGYHLTGGKNIDPSNDT